MPGWGGEDACEVFSVREVRLVACFCVDAYLHARELFAQLHHAVADRVILLFDAPLDGL